MAPAGQLVTVDRCRFVLLPAQRHTKSVLVITMNAVPAKSGCVPQAGHLVCPPHGGKSTNCIGCGPVLAGLIGVYHCGGRRRFAALAMAPKAYLGSTDPSGPGNILRSPPAKSRSLWPEASTDRPALEICELRTARRYPDWIAPWICFSRPSTIKDAPVRSCCRRDPAFSGMRSRPVLNKLLGSLEKRADKVARSRRKSGRADQGRLAF